MVDGLELRAEGARGKAEIGKAESRKQKSEIGNRKWDHGPLTTDY
jgi:hypothetical protein